MREPMSDGRRAVLDDLAEAWAQRDHDNPQGAGADAGAAASALAEALAALDAASVALATVTAERDEARDGRDAFSDRIDHLNQRHEEDEAYRQHTIAERDAALAEIERLRERDATLDAAATALDCAPREVATVAARLRERATDLSRRTAADERADVVAEARRVVRVMHKFGSVETAVHFDGFSDRIEQGAHVGAAKGGER